MSVRDDSRDPIVIRDADPRLVENLMLTEKVKELRRQAEEDRAAIADANEHWDKHGQVPACDLWRSLHPAAIARAEQ